MKKIIAIIFFLNSIVFAQDLKISWSNKLDFNTKDLYMNSVQGTNSAFVYTLYAQSSKIKLVSFEKSTLKKSKEAMLYGFPQNDKDREILSDCTLNKIVILENTIYVFWYNESRKKDELYVQTFNAATLKAQAKLKKIYESVNVKGNEKKTEIFILSNSQNKKEQLIVGAEKSTNKGENIKIEFKVLNSDLSISNAIQSELPLVVKGSSNGLAAKYNFGIDGNLYMKFKNSLTIINSTNGEKKSYNFENENKQIYSLEYIETENNVGIFGFYSDLKIDKKGNSMHGIMMAQINTRTLELNSSKYIAFSKQVLEKLFTPETKKKNSYTLDYGIEGIHSINDEYVIVASSFNNYVVTSTSTSNGRTTTTQTPHCKKENIGLLRLTKSGDVKWASTIDRRIDYIGWDVLDIEVINNNQKLYLSYGSSFDIDAKKKNFTSKKSKKDQTNKFEYSALDMNSGVVSRKELIINKEDTPKKEKKIVSPSVITPFDNKFYVIHSKTRLKPAAYALGPFLCCAGFFPALYVGEGNLGVISPY